MFTMNIFSFIQMDHVDGQSLVTHWIWNPGYEMCYTWAQKYGVIMTLHLRSKLVVFNNIELIREVSYVL